MNVRKLSENWKRIEQRVGEAASRARRDPKSVTIVAVTKTASVEIVQALVDLGVRDLGENRVQEFARRAALLKEWLDQRSASAATTAVRPRWHMIGHLQRNKVKALLPWVDVIQTVDSLRLAEEIDAQAGKIGRVIPILLEVNASGESNKTGVAVAAAIHLAEQIRTLRQLDLRGLMAMGPLSDDRERVRQAFGRVRELFDEIVGERVAGPQFRELSMGMSADFEIGIELGATCVRIGSALFEGMELPAEPAVTES